MSNLLTMSPQQIEQQALGIINTMLQQNGVQGGINGVVQQVQVLERDMFKGMAVKAIVDRAASSNNIPANGNPSQILQNALQGQGGFADHASQMLYRSIQQVSEANPSLAGNQLAQEITNHFIASAQNDQTTRNYLGFVNDIVAQAKGFGQLQQVPTINIEMLRQPLQQQLATLVPQQRESAAPQQPANNTPARSSTQEQPSSPPPSQQTRSEAQPKPETPAPAPTTPRTSPSTSQTQPKAKSTADTAPQNNATTPKNNAADTSEDKPSTPNQTQTPNQTRTQGSSTPQTSNQSTMPPAQTPTQPAASTTQPTNQSTNPTTPPANQSNASSAAENSAPTKYNAENINNIMRGLKSELRTEDEYYAIQKALDDGFNGRYKNRGGFLDSIGSMFGDIGNVLMGLFAAVMGIFQGRNPITVFQDYMASDGTGQQMRDSLQIIQEMSPIEMGYSDPSTGVTGQDLMEAHAYRLEVVRAQRKIDDHLKSRRSITGHDLEEAYASLDEAEARFEEFDMRFKARFGESAETAFKKFEARKEGLQYAVAEQLGIEARANGLVDTPRADELMYAYRTNGPAPSLDPRNRRETIGREMARDNSTTVSPRNQRESRSDELELDLGGSRQQNYSDPSQYRPMNLENGELSFEVSDARVITSPSATPSSRGNERNLELQL